MHCGVVKEVFYWGLAVTEQQACWLITNNTDLCSRGLNFYVDGYVYECGYECARRNFTVPFGHMLHEVVLLDM